MLVFFYQSRTAIMKQLDESHLIVLICVLEGAKWWEWSACWPPTAQSSETTFLSQRWDLCFWSMVDIKH